MVQQSSMTMTKEESFNGTLDNAVWHLPREMQIKIFKHFLYCPLTVTVDLESTTYYQIPLCHAYKNINYIKEQIKIHHGIPKSEQHYIIGARTLLTPDENFIDYGITRDVFIIKAHFSCR